ncbi:hypothetical protein H8702_09990 [Massilimaliae timonensis]|uniref:Uncharacterized protein n=1 Tax=Massiliimalia timonensis TaxID=1987501 RepID=A0A8J6P883_9FIRM|nr:DUF6100 family protein [Massiliimalia timonensis]MBC8611430.1 hypothetical protein [Massiliimalia timonensis]
MVRRRKKIDQKKRYDRIRKVVDDGVKLNNGLFALTVTDAAKYPEQYDTLLLNSAYLSESIAVRMRKLAIDLGSVQKHKLLENAAKIQRIRIVWKDGILTVVIPSLLPKRQQRTISAFLLDPLYYTLHEFCEKEKFQKFRECVVCFIHVYDEKLSISRIRDYDNMMMKPVLDTVAAFVMTDDTGQLCRQYQTSVLGDSDRTEIMVMEPKRFLLWLREQEKQGS